MNNEKDQGLWGIITVIEKWKKPILLFVFIATLMAACISFFILPRLYYAGTTVLPVNSMLTDKARIFGTNIQELYSVYGTADDLDRMYTIAKAGTVPGFVVDSLKLIDHFGIQRDQHARTKAVLRLKKNINILKTESGALQIDVWDEDANTAAGIANLVVYKITTIGNDLLKQANHNIIDHLWEDVQIKQHKYTQLLDSISKMGILANAPMTKNAEQLIGQIERDEKIIDEFSLASNVDQPCLLVLEKAYPSLKADKPNHLFIIITACLLSLFFGILASLVINRIKN
jgi:capsular polysaccharide biosynthesis protein